MLRHSKLSQLSYAAVDDAFLTKEGANLLVNGLEDLHGKIKEINIGNSIEQVSMGQTRIEEHVSIDKPRHLRAEGCGKRLKKTKRKSNE